MPKVFISHSWEDNEISRKLAEYLRRDGADVWIDYARIEGGDSLPKVISNAIDWCEVLVLVWSISAVDSYWVEEEWTCAHSLRKRIVPCLLDKAKLPSILLSKLYIDFNDFELGYNSLSRALKLTVKIHKTIPTKSIIEPKTKIIKPKPKRMIFRSLPKEISVDELEDILIKYNFFDKKTNKNGHGFENLFDQQTFKSDKIIFDEASGLIWQKYGSSKRMNFVDSKKWIEKLNHDGFESFKNWRLPTLEEAMSLMEPEQKNGDLYIDPIFDKTQRYIWTSDLIKGESRSWIVNFDHGSCGYGYSHINCFVRAVHQFTITKEVKDLFKDTEDFFEDDKANLDLLEEIFKDDDLPDLSLKEDTK